MIAWLDLETTGLDARRGSILELAMILTDDKLNEISRHVSLVRPLHLRGLEVMDDYVKTMHAKSGLNAEIFDFDAFYATHDSVEKGVVPIRENVPRLGDVERAAIDWLRFNAMGVGAFPEEDVRKKLRDIPLGGNSVHFDRTWIREHMPDLEALFSHRNFDVSAVTERCKRYAPKIHAGRPGVRPDGTVEPKHRAIDDIEASIATERYYRDTIFAPILTIDCSKEPIVNFPNVP